MPRLGMEPLRRKALIDAALVAIGERGSLDVTMSDIAGRAGVSSALAHHYFGAKVDLLEATMRHILRELAGDTVAALRGVCAPRERLRRIVEVNFSAAQFRPQIVAAWLAFYVEAQRAPAMRRLLRVYARRLNSNLLHALHELQGEAEAERTAEAVAAMIDGFYIRRALGSGASGSTAAVATVLDYLETKLAKGVQKT